MLMLNTFRVHHTQSGEVLRIDSSTPCLLHCTLLLLFCTSPRKVPSSNKYAKNININNPCTYAHDMGDSLATCTECTRVACQPRQDTAQLVRSTEPAERVLSRPNLLQAWHRVQERRRHPDGIEVSICLRGRYELKIEVDVVRTKCRCNPG